MRIYITNCSAKKADEYRGTDTAVTPDVLYTSSKTQCFIRECKARKVRWAIFSDLYGIWFPEEKHCWYEKNPKNINEDEFRALMADFDEKLNAFNEICFYRNPGRFHFLYKRIVNTSRLNKRINLISRKDEII